MISLEKLKILAHTQKLPKTVGDLGKFLCPKALKSYPKSKKLPNLVTLARRAKTSQPRSLDISSTTSVQYTPELWQFGQVHSSHDLLLPIPVEL